MKHIAIDVLLYFAKLTVYLAVIHDALLHWGINTVTQRPNSFGHSST